MKSNYKQLGRYIRPVDVRNRDLAVSRLLGVGIAKEFMPSIANTVGTDMSNYKVVRKGQFAYGPVTSRNGDKISVALLREPECIISQAYTAFEIINTEELDPEYLMLWFSRPEFDRYARYHSHGSVREIFSWDDMCRVELPVPDICEQRRLVARINALKKRIALLCRISVKIEASAQKIFDELLLQESDISTIESWVNFNPKRTLIKGQIANCYEMSSLPTQGACLTKSEKKAYNGGMRFRNGDTLIARITPCLENGKAAYVNNLEKGEVAFGSTEVIVLEAKNPAYSSFPYFLVRNKRFVSFATEFLNGSSGRQRVAASQLASFKLALISQEDMDKATSIGQKTLNYMGRISKEIEILQKTIHTQIQFNS